MNRRVVVTGFGVIAPNGIGKEEFWRNCCEGNAAVSRIPEQWRSYSEYTSTLWAPLPEIRYEDYSISRIEKMQQGDTTLLLLAATHQALTDAGLARTLVDRKKNIYAVEALDPLRSGVFIGTGIGGISSLIESQSYHTFTPVKERLTELSEVAGASAQQQEQRKKSITSIAELLIRPFRFNPFAVSIIMPNACSSVPGIKYGLKGPNQTLTSACASGTIAVGNAFKAIQRGTADCVLTGGIENLYDPFGGLYRGFDQTKALVSNCDDPSTANRPFDTDRSGFLFSQGGAAMLVLEEENHAKDRGAEIIAEITGFAESFDAHNIMMMEEGGEAIVRMISDALDDASLPASEIDYINAHATGTRLNDEIEAGIIERIFGAKPRVNSTKSLIGHTLGASGAIEAIVTALSCKDDTTHICKNLRNPVRDLNFVTEAGHCEINHALSQSFAFGGHNAALVMKKYGI
ncbi:MAG: hypothetical protein GF401_13755 [Chitinivibrionales bacterium]|nr:hypothetical protein [Chitinivibrionales bacterium]